LLLPSSSISAENVLFPLDTLAGFLMKIFGTESRKQEMNPLSGLAAGKSGGKI
jgi:hypothetical protein